jgi:AI-2 transport protein TqsA
MDRRERERRILVVCALVLTTIAVGVTLHWLRGVMIPFVLAVLLAYGLAPLVDIQRASLRLPRWLAVATTLLLAFFLLGMLGSVTAASVQQFDASRDTYQRQLQELIRVLTELVPEDLGPPGGFDPSQIVSTQRVGAALLGATNAILSVVSQGFVVLVFLFFLLMGGVGSGIDATSARGVVEGRIKRYIVLQTAISAATGIAVWLTLALLGVPLALVFGLFAFLLNFIPNLGSIVATLLPLPVVILSPEVSVTSAVLAIAIPGAIQMLLGNVVSPAVMGDSLELDPIVILLSLMIWGTLWGVLGMLLATPITAVLKLLFARLETTAPLARVMAGRYAQKGSG